MTPGKIASHQDLMKRPTKSGSNQNQQSQQKKQLKKLPSSLLKLLKRELLGKNPNHQFTMLKLMRNGLPKNQLKLPQK